MPKFFLSFSLSISISLSSVLFPYNIKQIYAFLCSHPV
jgi:hypothetical protein